MRRKLYTFAATASPLICVMLAALWARSHRAGETLGYDSSMHDISVSNMRGSLLFQWMHHLDLNGKPTDRSAEASGWYYHKREPWMIERLPGNDCWFWNYTYGAGVAWGERWREDQSSVMIPHWLLGLIPAAATIGLLVRRPKPPRKGIGTAV